MFANEPRQVDLRRFGDEEAGREKNRGAAFELAMSQSGSTVGPATAKFRRRPALTRDFESCDAEHLDRDEVRVRVLQPACPRR